MKCEICGKKGKIRIDKYQRDINNKIVKRCLCNKCDLQISQGI